MKALTVYAVCTPDDPPMAFATKGAALKEARRQAREEEPQSDGDVTVESWQLVPMTKDVIVRLLNVAGGYLTDHTVIATFPYRRDTRRPHRDAKAGAR